MIGQFVDDLLQAIREATIDELRELLVSAEQDARSGRLDLSVARATSEQTLRSTPGRIGRVIRIRRNIATTSTPPPAVAEITDPESLLSLGASEPHTQTELVLEEPTQKVWLDPTLSLEIPPRAPKSLLAEASAGGSKRSNGAEGPHELELDSPVSGVRPVEGAVSVRLSDNETLARISNAGIVIRRRKKA